MLLNASKMRYRLNWVTDWLISLMDRKFRCMLHVFLILFVYEFYSDNCLELIQSRFETPFGTLVTIQTKNEGNVKTAKGSAILHKRR